MSQAASTNLADIPRRQARLRPRSPAYSDGVTGLDYGTLDSRASQVANGLLAEGCVGQDRVAILTRNGPEFCEILMGCLKAGLVTLPVNWRLAAPEIAYVLSHAQVGVVFCASEFAALAASAAQEAGVRRLILIGGADDAYETWRDRQSAADPMAPVQTSDTAVQMYTSGTTGHPKGVELSHAGFQVALDVMQDFAWGRLGPDDVVLAPAPFFHVNGLNPILRTFSAGGCLVSPPQFEAARVPALIEACRITRTTLAPAMIQACLGVEDLAARDLSSLQVISYGGSPISETVLDQARAAFGCAFVQMYGLTETNGPVSFLTPEDHADGTRLMSCGRAAPGVELRVTGLDGSVLATGEVGEVRLRTAALMKGYWRDPEATAAAIDDGWFRTGDAGYLDDQGFLFIHDRLKDMIVSGGENIYPAEVENALAAHPAVADVAVIGVPDARWGEAVKALVTLRPGETVTPEELVAFARGRIAGYKLPKSVEWIAEIPRNPAGKILRRRLREPYWAGAKRNVA